MKTEVTYALEDYLSKRTIKAHGLDGAVIVASLCGGNMDIMKGKQHTGYVLSSKAAPGKFAVNARHRLVCLV